MLSSLQQENKVMTLRNTNKTELWAFVSWLLSFMGVLNVHELPTAN